MHLPRFEPSWPESWRTSYGYDLLESNGAAASNRGYQYAYARRKNCTLDAVSRYVSRGASILDVAGAQGNFSLALAESGYAVTWNDLRTELEGYVRLKYERGILRFAPGDVFQLPFSDAFDAVLITEVIEHVAHPDRLLANAGRLVRPGGIIIMTTPNGGYFRNRLPKFSECSDPSRFEAIQFQPDASGHIFLLHPDEISILAREAGLDLVEIRTYTNFLTNGRAGTHHLLRYLPRWTVGLMESFTSVAGGTLFQRFNTGMIAVFRRVDA